MPRLGICGYVYMEILVYKAYQELLKGKNNSDLIPIIFNILMYIKQK